MTLARSSVREPRKLQHAPKSTAGSLMAAHFSLISEKGERVRFSRAPRTRRSTHGGADLCAAARRCTSQTCRQRAESGRSPLRRRHVRARAATQRRVSGQLQWARAPAAHAAQGAAAGRGADVRWVRAPQVPRRGRARACCRRKRTRPQLNRSGPERALAGEACGPSCACRV